MSYICKFSCRNISTLNPMCHISLYLSFSLLCGWAKCAWSSTSRLLYLQPKPAGRDRIQCIFFFCKCFVGVLYFTSYVWLLLECIYFNKEGELIFSSLHSVYENCNIPKWALFPKFFVSCPSQQKERTAGIVKRKVNRRKLCNEMKWSYIQKHN